MNFKVLETGQNETKIKIQVKNRNNNIFIYGSDGGGHPFMIAIFIQNGENIQWEYKYYSTLGITKIEKGIQLALANYASIVMLCNDIDNLTYSVTN